MHRHRKALALYAKDDGLKHVFDLLEHLIEWHPRNNEGYLIQCVDVVETLWLNSKARRVIMDYNILNELFTTDSDKVAPNVVKRILAVISNIQSVFKSREYPWMDLIDYALSVARAFYEEEIAVEAINILRKYVSIEPEEGEYIYEHLKDRFDILLCECTDSVGHAVLSILVDIVEIKREDITREIIRSCFSEKLEELFKASGGKRKLAVLLMNRVMGAVKSDPKLQ